MGNSRWRGSDSRQTWQTLLTVQPKGSAFLVVHAVSRFSATWARAGGTLFPCCRVYQVTSCNVCNRLHLLLHQSLTVSGCNILTSLIFRPLNYNTAGSDETSKHRYLWWLVLGRAPCASGKHAVSNLLGRAREISGAIIVRHKDGLLGTQSNEDDNYPGSTVDIRASSVGDRLRSRRVNH